MPFDAGRKRTDQSNSLQRYAKLNFSRMGASPSINRIYKVKLFVLSALIFGSKQLLASADRFVILSISAAGSILHRPGSWDVD